MVIGYTSGNSLAFHCLVIYRKCVKKCQTQIYSLDGATANCQVYQWGALFDKLPA